MKIEINDLLTPSQAAESRGVSRQAMNDLIKRGKIPVVLIAGQPFVKKQDVDAYEPDPGGRPRKDAANQPTSKTDSGKAKKK